MSVYQSVMVKRVPNLMNSRVIQVYEVYDFICSIRKKNLGVFDCKVHILNVNSMVPQTPA